MFPFLFLFPGFNATVMGREAKVGRTSLIHMNVFPNIRKVKTDYVKGKSSRAERLNEIKKAPCWRGAVR